MHQLTNKYYDILYNRIVEIARKNEKPVIFGPELNLQPPFPISCICSDCTANRRDYRKFIPIRCGELIYRVFPRDPRKFDVLRADCTEVLMDDFFKGLGARA